MRRLIEKFTKEGDLIIDPYCGSGSTLVACAKLGREFIGCDINPKYCKIADERIRKELSQTKLTVGFPPKPKVLGILPNLI